MRHGVGTWPRHSRFGSVRLVAAIGAAILLSLGVGAPGGPAGAASPDAVTTDPLDTTPVDTTPVHVDNPYRDAQLYVDPEWSAQAAADGGALIANQPTAVWLDSIASITHRDPVPGGSYRTMGLAEHLDAALTQGADAVQLVLWNLPGRSCSRLGPHGELGPDEFDRYRTEFVDPIAAILARPEYAHLRIITVVEPDSLPRLLSGSGDYLTDACQAIQNNGAYQKGVIYALSQLHALPNVYTYLDAGEHGWLGWDDSFRISARLLADAAAEATGGRSRVDGVIVNIAGYSALVEPFLEVNEWTRETKWIDWNRYVDELSYGTAYRDTLLNLGFDPALGLIIDTSRNGWGGPDRPTAKTPGDDDAAVDANRIDRRPASWDRWCNQRGAGLGERPQADPVPGVDAYVWVKPPGESDGAHGVRAAERVDGVAGDDGTAATDGAEPMCDPDYRVNRGIIGMTGALAGGPPAGAWFSAHFQFLLANAYPPL